MSGFLCTVFIPLTGQHIVSSILYATESYWSYFEPEHFNMSRWFDQHTASSVVKGDLFKLVIVHIAKFWYNIKNVSKPSYVQFIWFLFCMNKMRKHKKYFKPNWSRQISLTLKHQFHKMNKLNIFKPVKRRTHWIIVMMENCEKWKIPKSVRFMQFVTCAKTP